MIFLALMNFNTRRFNTIALALAMTLANAAPAIAQTYPTRPIRMVVPQAAGSTADILARVIGAEMAKELGQAIVVENKVGAGGTIASSDVANSVPDGYTIGIASQGTLVFNQALYAKPGYDSLKDFSLIGLIGGVSNVLIVPPASDAKTVMELVAKATAKPGSLSYSSGGSGTSHHLSGVLFSQLMGIDLLHVPYKGAPQGILAVMSGEVDMAFYNTPTVLTQIKSGKVKALAVTSKTRSALLADVPTMDASGVKGYEVNTWLGLIGTAGTPRDVVLKLNQALIKVMTKPAMREKLVAQGVDIAKDPSPETFGKLLRSDMESWPAIIKKSGARVD